MMTIWKFQFAVEGDGTFTLEMPAAASVLTVQAQVVSQWHDFVGSSEYNRVQPCIWAMVDPEAPKTKRHFVVYGTGQKIDLPNEFGAGSHSLKYIGTFQVPLFVWHLFEYDRK